jgi:drug/metabolite transporter (DMT)-like permease
MDRTTRPPTWQVLLAFGIVYFVWGSTFLAIRVGVREVPPFLLAAMRFLLAGSSSLRVDAGARHGFTESPRVAVRGAAGGADIRGRLWNGLLGGNARAVGSNRRHVGDHSGVHGALGNLFPGNAAADACGWRCALLVGIGGVIVLVSHSLGLGESAIDPAGAIALLIGAMSWSVAAALSRKLPLPASKPMSSAAQMFCGGVWLTLTSAALREYRGFHPLAVSRAAWIALAYLIVAGSIIAFTAYVWLIHHESPTRVGTYAYVNPVIAVALGYFFAGEAVGARTLLGTLLVLVSVVVITTMPARKSAPARLEEVLPAGEASEG